MTETELLARKSWRHLTAQIHREPLRVTPVMVGSVPQTEIVLQLSGAIRIAINDGLPRHYETGPGTLYLTAAHQLAYEVSWHSLSEDPVQSLHLYLDNDLLAQAAAADAGLDAAKLEIREGSCLDDHLLRQLGYALVREMEAPEARNDLYADTVAQMLAAQVIRRHGIVRADASHTIPKLSADRLRLLRDYVQAHLKGAIVLHELAALVSLSPYHFCRVFKRTTGQSPNQYVIAQRIARAAHLLRHTRMTIAHIASEVGYQSVGHFELLFRRHTGYAPTEYAKRHLR